MGVVLLDDPAQIGNMPVLYDDVHMGSKGSTGDLRFEPSQNAASSLKAQKEVSYIATELQPSPLVHLLR